MVWPTDESAPTKTMPCERRQDLARPHTSQLAWSGPKLPTNRQQLVHQGYAGSGLSVHGCSDGVDIWFHNQRHSIERPRPMLLQLQHELREVVPGAAKWCFQYLPPLFGVHRPACATPPQFQSQFCCFMIPSMGS